MAYKKNPVVLPLMQPVHWRFRETDFEVTRRHWRTFHKNSKRKIRK